MSRASALKAWITRRRGGGGKLSMTDIVRRNVEGGSRFFSPSTLKVYRTKINRRVYQGKGGAYFVTSEQKPGGRRLFTVRSFHRPTGRVVTAGQFQQWWTSTDAQRQAVRLAHRRRT